MQITGYKVRSHIVFKKVLHSCLVNQLNIFYFLWTEQPVSMEIKATIVWKSKAI